MSAKPFLLLGLAGMLGIAALGMLAQGEARVITLESGLGPVVEASRL